MQVRMAAPKSPFAASVAIHTGAALIIFSVASVHVEKIPIAKRHVPLVDVAPFPKSIKLPARPPGGGGGGDRSPLPVSKGRLPKISPRPFAPPMIREKSEAPLLVEPALLSVEDPALLTVNLAQWGDPLSKSLLYSNGPGKKGGQGDGENNGVGPGKGPRSGPNSGVNGSYPVSGLNITTPKVIYQVEPEFSEEARRAKHQGSVLLSVEVDANGRVSNIRVVKSLGLGLDEKAIEAVRLWRFRPAQKNGKPVTVPATIDVNFHLL